MNANRSKLIIIFAVFLMPLAASFVWYYGIGARFVPEGRTNHAPLVSPVITLAPFFNTKLSNPNLSNSNSDNPQFTIESLHRKWSIIHTLTQQCDTACEKFLYHTRQTRLALGKDANRVQRIFLSPNRDLLNHLAPTHPDAIRLPPAENGIETQLTPIIQQHNIDAHDALLIDPLGNIMLRIPTTLDPRLLLKDLKKLLKISRIG